MLHKHNLFVVVLLSITIFLQGNAQNNTEKTGSSITAQEAKDALAFHNEIRKEVKVPPLEWSAELAAYAQQWADHIAKTCNLDHRPYEGPWAQKYGENIFWGSGEDYQAIDASKSWYEEKKMYRYGVLNESNWYETGHYTQMIWRSTTKVGIAKSVCKDGAIIIVANYSPGGNVMGQKPY